MNDETSRLLQVSAALLGLWGAAKVATKYPFTRGQAKRQIRSEFRRQGKLREFLNKRKGT